MLILGLSGRKPIAGENADQLLAVIPGTSLTPAKILRIVESNGTFRTHRFNYRGEALRRTLRRMQAGGLLQFKGLCGKTTLVYTRGAKEEKTDANLG